MAASLNELERLCEQLNGVTTPEDLFGAANVAESNYRRLIRLAHPDLNPAFPDLAKQTSTIINNWWARATDRLKAGIYGTTAADATPVVLTSRKGTYALGKLWFRGDIADLYRTESGLIVKVGRSPKDSDLLSAEAANLTKIHQAIASKDTRSVFTPFYPVLIDSFRVKLAHGAVTANVLKVHDGMYSLREVHKLKGKLDPRDWAWMYRRLLSVLGFTHQRVGLVHGAVNLDHVLIHSDHGLTLIDWCYAVPVDTVLKAIPSSHQLDYSGVKLQEAAKPSLDIYLASHIVARHMLSESLVPVRMMRFFNSWKAAGAHQVQDAWALSKEFTDLLDDHWPRAYRPFTMEPQ